MKIHYYVFESVVASGGTTSWGTKWCIILTQHRQMRQSLQQQRCKHRSAWMLSEMSLCRFSELFSCSNWWQQHSKREELLFLLPLCSKWSSIWHLIKFTLRSLGEGVLWKPIKEIARQATDKHARNFIHSKDYPYQRKENFRILWAWPE